MRRLFLLTAVLFVLAFTNTVFSQILLDENFNYPAGDSLGAHGWISFSGGATNVLSVATSGLTYSGYNLSNIGNSARVRQTGQDAYVQFANTDTVNNVYISFLVKVDSMAGTGDYFLGLLPDNSTSNYTGRIYYKDTLGSLKFGIAKATNPIVYTPNTYNYNQTYLLVIKYVFVAGASNDVVNLFVLSGAIPGTEPAPTIANVTQAIGDAANITRVALRQGSSGLGGILLVDGIRVSRAWGNMITGINPVSTVAENYSLSQNFPNPFNPSTKINFSIPERSFVTLKIYDAAGREVMELINGDYSKGVYSFDFNAAGLSSGIYFYSLEAKSESGNIYKDTKKLSLVK